MYAAIELDKGPFHAGLQESHRSFQGFGASMLGTAAVLGGGMIAALGIGKLVGAIGTITVAYQDSLNTFQAVSHATAAQMELVDQKATQLGNDLSLPSTSASDAAIAMTELAKAGLDVNQSMAASKGVLELAAAANTDAGTAATYTATALNAFHLSGEKAMMVADLLAASANASAAEIGDMALAMQQSAAGAEALHIPIQDLTTMIAEMANAGIKGSDAGTSIKMMLQYLIPTTKQAKDAMKDLGVSAFDAHGNMRPMPELIGQFQAGLSKLSPEEKSAALNTIFHSDAARAANIIFGQSVDTYNKLHDAVTQEGAAAEVAAAKAKGLGGALRGVQSELQGLAKDIGQAVSPAIEGLVRWFADQLPKAIDATKKALGDFSKAAGPFVQAYQENVGKALKDSEGSFDSLRRTFEDVRKSMDSFVKSPAFAALVAHLVVTLPNAFRVAIAAEVVWLDTLKEAGTAFIYFNKIIADVGRGDFVQAWKDMAEGARTQAENIMHTDADMANFQKATLKATSKDTEAEWANMQAKVLNATNKGNADQTSAVQHQAAVLAHEYRNSGETAQEQLAEGIKAGSGKAVVAETQATRDAIEAGRREAAGAQGIGTLISQGVALGIIQAGGQVDAAARAQIRNALREMKATAVTGSPSRLFAEQVGKPIAQGVALGIEEAAHLPMAAAAAMIGAAASIRGAIPSGAMPAMAGAGAGPAGMTLNVYGAEMKPYEIAQELAWYSKTKGY